MAWHNGGNWGSIPVKDVNHLLAELCYAVNERQDIVGKVEQTWSMPGANTNYPTPATYENMRVAVWHDFAQTVAEVQAAIEDLVENPLSTDYEFWDLDNNRAWTIADLLTAVGLGASWLAFDRPQNTAVWAQMRAALDRLRYFRVLSSWAFPGNVTYGEGTHGSNQETSYDNAVAALTAGQPADSLFDTQRVAQQVRSAGGAYTTALATSIDVEFGPITVAAGTLRRAWVDLYEEHLVTGGASGDMAAISLAGPGFEWTLSAASGAGKVLHSFYVESPTLQTATATTVTLTWTPPLDHIFTSSLPLNASKQRRLTKSSLGAHNVTFVSELLVGTDLTYG